MGAVSAATNDTTVTAQIAELSKGVSILSLTWFFCYMG